MARSDVRSLACKVFPVIVDNHPMCGCPTDKELIERVIAVETELERARSLIALYVLEAEAADCADEKRRERLREWAASGGITGPYS